jgi:hypothetical protein
MMTTLPTVCTQPAGDRAAAISVKWTHAPLCNKKGLQQCGWYLLGHYRATNTRARIARGLTAIIRLLVQNDGLSAKGVWGSRHQGCVRQVHFKTTLAIRFHFDIPEIPQVPCASRW